MTNDAKTRSGIPLKAFYEAEGGVSDDLGAPGTYPYTRGRYARTRSGGSWIQRELSGEGSPTESNELMRYLLEIGQTGVDIIGDAPTMSMMDPDHPLSVPTAGTQGVSACCKQDYLELLDGIPITETSVSSSIPAVFTIAGLVHTAKHTNAAPEKLRGSTIQVPLYQEDCSYRIHLPVNFRSRLSADCVEYCADKLPRFHVFLEDTYYFSESGLNGVEEMALGFVEIRHLMRLLISRGVDVDTFAPRIAILLNCSMDFFEEIAKIRATRPLFARMMRDEFGAKDPRSQSVVITSHTSGLAMTAQQPVNNIVRGSLQSLSLVLAGVQAIEISAFDEALRTPSRESHLVSLRTQQIIDLESGVTKVADPLGGSYYVEALTDDIEQRIWDMVLDIESKGDVEELVDQGYFKEIFHGVMERQSQNVASGEDQVVGVNVHQLPPEDDTMLRDLTDSKFPPCKDHIERIKAYKESRDQNRLQVGLKPILEASKTGSGNLLALTVDAFEAGATAGEVSGTFRQGCGGAYDPFGQVEAVI